MFSDPYIANPLTIDRNCDSDHHLLRHPEPTCARALKPWTMTMAGSLTDKTAARPRSPPRVNPSLVSAIIEPNSLDEEPQRPGSRPGHTSGTTAARPVYRNRRTVIGTSIDGIIAAALSTSKPG